MTTQTIERKGETCHQCENWKPYKELATFKYDGGRTVWFSPFICLDCHKTKRFIEWKKVINTNLHYYKNCDKKTRWNTTDCENCRKDTQHLNNKGDETMIYKCNCPKCETKINNYVNN